MTTSNTKINKYMDIEDKFEAVRNTDSEMRDEAEYQIFVLNKKVPDLESQLENKNSEIVDLEQRLVDLELKSEKML